MEGGGKGGGNGGEAVQPAAMCAEESLHAIRTSLVTRSQDVWPTCHMRRDNEMEEDFT